jgi:hypothetical protein
MLLEITYCILQKDIKTGEQTIHNLVSEHLFFATINGLLNGKYEVNIVNENLSTNIETDDKYVEGYYLLCSEKFVKLIKKSKIISKGYIYNSTYFEIETIMTWDLLQFLKHADLSETKTSVSIETPNEITHEEIIPVGTPIESITETIPEEIQNESDDEPITDDGKKYDKFYIKEFKFGKMCHNPTVCLIGKDRISKFLAICGMIDELRISKNQSGPLTHLLIICPNEELFNAYQMNYPDADVLSAYDEKAIKNYLYNASVCINDGLFFNGCIVFDTCCPPGNVIEENPSFMELILNSKHYNTSVFITRHTPLGLNLMIRSQFDYVFMYTENNYHWIKKLYDLYGFMFPNFTVFETIIKAITPNQGAMVVYNDSSRGTDMFEQVFWFKSVRDNL